MAPDILRPKVINLNILPEEYREPELPIPPRTLGLVLIALALLATLLFLGQRRFAGKVNELETRLKQTEQQVAQTKGQSEEAAKLNETLGKTNNDIKRLEQTHTDIFASRVNWATVSQAIFGLAPAEMILTSVLQENDRVTVKGQSQDERTVTRYIGDLRQTGLFTSVNLESTSPLLTPVVFPTTTPAPGETPPTTVPEATVTPAETITPTITATPTATEVPIADEYEFDQFGNPQPDDFTPQEVIVGTSQLHNFYPDFDVDKAKFLAKAGRQYQVFTSSLAQGVDTILKVTLGGQTFTNDDRGPGDFSSFVQFENQTGRDQEALVTVSNRGQFGGEMTYFLNIGVGFVDRDTFEVDDVIPKAITAGETQAHNFFPEGDIDKVEFLAKARRWYRVTTSGLAPGVDTRLTVSVGGLVFQNDDIGPGDLASEVTFQATSDSRAVVTIVNLGQFGTEMSYSIGVEEFEPEVPPTNTPTPQPGDAYEPDSITPKPIALGESQAHTFDPDGDVDKVKFGVKADRWYIVTTASLALGVDTKLTVSVGGTVLENDDIEPGNLASEVRFKSTVNGTALVTIVNLGLSGPDKSYNIGVEELEGDTYEPDDVTPSPIALGETQSHTFDPDDDVDKVAFLAKTGRWYRVTTSGLASGVDTRLTVSVGGLVFQNDDIEPGNLASEVTFQAPSDSEAVVTIVNLGQFGVSMAYSIGVSEFLPMPTPTVTFTPVPTATPTPFLTPTITNTPGPTNTPTITPTPTSTPCVACDEFEPDDDNPTDIFIGAPQVHNFLPTGDVDRVRFLAKAGHRYRVFTSDLAVGVDTVLEVDVGGTIYTNDDRIIGDVTSGSWVGFLVPGGSDLTVFAKVSNRGQFGDASTYTLTLEEVGPADQYEVDDSVPKPIILGEIQNHNFYPDNDFDKVEFLTKAQRWYLVTTSSLAPGVDTHLRVEVGGAVYENDDIGPGVKSSRVLFQSPMDVAATVTIRNFGQYGPDKDYSISVEELPFSPDRFEYDDVTPRPIVVDDPPQVHSFYPPDDVDTLTFDAQSGRTYEVRTQNPTEGVDTFLEVTVPDMPLLSDPSLVTFTPTMPGPVQITISNRGVFGADATYEVLVLDLGPAASAPTGTLGSLLARLTGWLPLSARPAEAAPLQQDHPVEFVIVLQVKLGQ